MQARNPHIDALRGAAILCVLLLHFALAYGLKNSPLAALPDWLWKAAYQGNYGVTMFFVISGYLITSTSLRRWGDLARIDLAAPALARRRHGCAGTRRRQPWRGALKK